MPKKTLSQNLWLKRKKSDLFFAEAKLHGFRARSAYKLLEINEKFNVFKNFKNIVDLGASPGSWSQVLVKEKLAKKNNHDINIFAIDLKNIAPIKGVIIIKNDITAILEESNKLFAKNTMDLVLSDMAPKSSGHRFTDQAKAASLSEKALAFAIRYSSIVL